MNIQYTCAIVALFLLSAVVGLDMAVGLDPPGSVLLPNGRFCPAAYPGGECPPVSGAPKCDPKTLEDFSKLPIVYNVEAAYTSYSLQQICSRATAKGSRQYPDEEKFGMRAAVFDTVKQEPWNMHVNFSSPDPSDPSKVREEVEGLKESIYFQNVACGRREADGLVWSVAYNCSLADFEGNKYPMTFGYVSTSSPNPPEEALEEIHNVMQGMGISTCLFLPVPQPKKCDEILLK